MQIKNVPEEKYTAPTELFQLSRADFEDIMAQVCGGGEARAKL